MRNTIIAYIAGILGALTVGGSATVMLIRHTDAPVAQSNGGSHEVDPHSSPEPASSTPVATAEPTQQPTQQPAVATPAPTAADTPAPAVQSATPAPTPTPAPRINQGWSGTGNLTTPEFEVAGQSATLSVTTSCTQLAIDGYSNYGSSDGLFMSYGSNAFPQPYSRSVTLPGTWAWFVISTTTPDCSWSMTLAS